MDADEEEAVMDRSSFSRFGEEMDEVAADPPLPVIASASFFSFCLEEEEGDTNDEYRIKNAPLIK